MRYLILLCSLFLFVACAAELSPEEIERQSAYGFQGKTGETDQFPIATTDPDTLPLPKASANDRVPTPAGTPSPTPYGMTIEEPNTYGATKGVEENATAPALAAQKMLTGRWVNAQDALEMVEFTPTHYKTYYEGEMLVQEDMAFYGICPEACSGGTSIGQPCFTISGPAQTDCYGIVRLNEDVLELQMLGVSNETVIYRRADQ